MAYIVSGSYYENPLYWGDDCSADSGDCTIGGSGQYALWITAAAIYVGSTLADQTNVPNTALPPAFTDSAYQGFLAGADPQYQGGVGPTLYGWMKKIASVYTAVKLIYDAANQRNANPSSAYPPIPFLVDLWTDEYDAQGARERTFILKDIYGRPWNMNYPIRVREQFSDMTSVNGASAPSPTGIWYNLVPALSDNDQKIEDSEFTDFHRGTALLLGSEVNYLQYYYATDFQLPTYPGLSQLFSVPGFNGSAAPLWIKDTKNKCSPVIYLPAEGITMIGTSKGSVISIEGDNGPGTGCRN